MNILAIDTSCDETAASVTFNVKVNSSIVWSSSSLHAQFGGVLPSLAQRKHQERIDYVVTKALGTKHNNLIGIDAIAVTIGNGLAIALEVGINKAKELAQKYKLPLIPISHKEGHLLSAFAQPKTGDTQPLIITYPALGLVLSGKSTDLILIKDIGDYLLLAETHDDALGEALDKAARLLGFGYPGGVILEEMAKKGNSKRFTMPFPLKDDVVKNRFSYSGLKTAFVRLFATIKDPNKQDVADLAASFQDVAFEHIIKVLNYQIIHSPFPIKDLLFGGGVANNVLLRSKLRKLCNKYDIKLHLPYTKKLNGDNAAMIGVCAYLKYKDSDLTNFFDYESVDRNPKNKL